MAKLAQLYIKKILRLHGVPSSIVSDRDLSSLIVSSRRYMVLWVAGKP